MNEKLRELIKYSLNKNIRHKLNANSFHGLSEIDRYQIKDNDYEGMMMERMMKMGRAGMMG